MTLLIDSYLPIYHNKVCEEILKSVRHSLYNADHVNMAQSNMKVPQQYLQGLHNPTKIVILEDWLFFVQFYFAKRLNTIACCHLIKHKLGTKQNFYSRRYTI